MEITMTINQEHNGIELLFTDVPVKSVRESLKDNGFRWHNVKKVWYAKKTDDRIEFASSLINGNPTKATANNNSEFDFDVKVGDVFYSSWGYEQTNVDFFQVVALVGKKSVRIREVNLTMADETPMCSMAADRTYKIPTKIIEPKGSSVFIKDQEKGDLKRLKSYAEDGKSNPLIEIDSFARAYKYTGQAVYESWYY